MVKIEPPQPFMTRERNKSRSKMSRPFKKFFNIYILTYSNMYLYLLNDSENLFINT
jgi:hypothetical protein